GLNRPCDDTAAAIVTSDGQILSETNQHQYAVPRTARRYCAWPGSQQSSQAHAHVVRTTLEKASLTIADLDAIAVTRGPGLPASLAVCVAAGKTLAAVHGKPLVGVHHMEAHALMARMGSSLQFPYLCLLISGGHTLSIVVHDVNEYTQIGTTRDDSIGEAFDKVARDLGIPWIDAQDGGGPGPALELLAREGEPSRFPLPVPMDKSGTSTSPDFSFSGLKTRIRRMKDTREFDPCQAPGPGRRRSSLPVHSSTPLGEEDRAGV
ncbi:peptidase M22, glycoprotease, partial [Linderina pennispora]